MKKLTCEYLEKNKLWDSQWLEKEYPHYFKTKKDENTNKKTNWFSRLV